MSLAVSCSARSTRRRNAGGAGLGVGAPGRPHYSGRLHFTACTSCFIYPGFVVEHWTLERLAGTPVSPRPRCARNKECAPWIGTGWTRIGKDQRYLPWLRTPRVSRVLAGHWAKWDLRAAYYEPAQCLEGAGTDLPAWRTDLWGHPHHDRGWVLQCYHCKFACTHFQVCHLRHLRGATRPFPLHRAARGALCLHVVRCLPLVICRGLVLPCTTSWQSGTCKRL